MESADMAQITAAQETARVTAMLWLCVESIAKAEIKLAE